MKAGECARAWACEECDCTCGDPAPGGLGVPAEGARDAARGVCARRAGGARTSGVIIGVTINEESGEVIPF